MSTWAHRAILAVALGHSSVETAVSQETEALFLPQDQEWLDELTVVGSTWTPELDGLARLSVPSSSSAIYVVDQVAALQGEISAALASLWRNDSDISIRFGVFGDEFAHLRRVAEGFELRYFRFENALPVQLRAFFEEEGYVAAVGRSNIWSTASRVVFAWSSMPPLSACCPRSALP